MTTGEYELPPHLARYLDSLSDPPAADPAAPEAPPKTTLPGPGTPPAIQADGHVDPAAAARWHQAQTELAALIRAENRLSAGPGREALLPASLADWMENRVAELEQAEASQPEPG